MKKKINKVNEQRRVYFVSFAKDTKSSVNADV